MIIKNGFINDAVNEKPYIADILIQDGKIVKTNLRQRLYLEFYLKDKKTIIFKWGDDLNRSFIIV